LFQPPPWRSESACGSPSALSRLPEARFARDGPDSDDDEDHADEHSDEDHCDEDDE